VAVYLFPKPHYQIQAEKPIWNHENGPTGKEVRRLSGIFRGRTIFQVVWCSGFSRAPKGKIFLA